MTEQKRGVQIELKSKQGDPEGSFTAVFSRLMVVDHDGDLTTGDAFKKGQKVPFTGNAGHDWKVPTTGFGVINFDSEKAWIDGQLNLKMHAGREQYESLKFAHENGVPQEYSYAYDVVKKGRAEDLKGQHPGLKRVLAGLDVKEVSPVLLGAGIGTGTLAIKGRKLMGGDQGWPADDSNDVCPVCGEPMRAHSEAIRMIHKELFDSVLKAQSITEEQLKADNIEPLSMKYADQAAEVLAHLEAFTARSKSLADLRAKVGRALSAENRERISGTITSAQAAVADLQKLLNEADAENADPKARGVKTTASAIQARLAATRLALDAHGVLTVSASPRSDN